MLTPEQVRAAGEALGWELKEDDVIRYLRHVDLLQPEQHVGYISECLAELEAEFDDAGGRGVALAEEIDALRVAAAVAAAHPDKEGSDA